MIEGGTNNGKNAHSVSKKQNGRSFNYLIFALGTLDNQVNVHTNL